MVILKKGPLINCLVKIDNAIDLKKYRQYSYRNKKVLLKLISLITTKLGNTCETIALIS